MKGEQVPCTGRPVLLTPKVEVMGFQGMRRELKVKGGEGISRDFKWISRVSGFEGISRDLMGDPPASCFLDATKVVLHPLEPFFISTE